MPHKSPVVIFVTMIYSLQLFGVPIAFDDPVVRDLLDFNEKVSQAFTIGGDMAETDSFPWLINVPLLSRRYKAKTEAARELRERAMGGRIREYMVRFFNMDRSVM